MISVFEIEFGPIFEFSDKHEYCANLGHRVGTHLHYKLLDTAVNAETLLTFGLCDELSTHGDGSWAF